MKRLFSLFLIIVTIYSCEKDDPVQYSSSLIGEWSWFISCGGVVGCTRPSENNSISLLFTVDSILYTYRNDTLYFSKNFHTYKRFSNEYLDTINIITYGSAAQEYILYHDTLQLINSDFRFSSGFKRIKQKHFP